MSYYYTINQEGTEAVIDENSWLKIMGNGNTREDMEKYRSIPLPTTWNHLDCNSIRNHKNVLILALSTLNRRSYWKADYQYEDQEGSNTKHLIYEYQLEPVPILLMQRLLEQGDYIDHVIVLATKDTRDINEKLNKDMEEESATDSLMCSEEDFLKDRIMFWMPPQLKEKMKNEDWYTVVELDEQDPSNGIRGTVERIRSIKSTQYSSSDVNLYIDPHGGFRGIMLALEAIVSLMRDEANIHTIFDISSQPGRPTLIRENDASFQLFDFVSGINEFINYGRIDSLDRYYVNLIGEEQAKKDFLLKGIRQIALGLQLCDLNSYQDGIRYLNRGIDEYEKETLKDKYYELCHVKEEFVLRVKQEENKKACIDRFIKQTENRKKNLEKNEKKVSEDAEEWRKRIEEYEIQIKKDIIARYDDELKLLNSLQSSDDAKKNHDKEAEFDATEKELMAEAAKKGILGEIQSLDIANYKKKSSQYISIFIDKIIEDYSSIIEAEDDFILQTIKWCAKKGFIQQALTFIEDKMPEFFITKLERTDDIDKAKGIICVQSIGTKWESRKITNAQWYHQLDHQIFYDVIKEIRSELEYKFYEGNESIIEYEVNENNPTEVTMLNFKYLSGQEDLEKDFISYFNYSYQPQSLIPVESNILRKLINVAPEEKSKVIRRKNEGLPDQIIKSLLANNIQKNIISMRKNLEEYVDGEIGIDENLLNRAISVTDSKKDYWVEAYTVYRIKEGERINPGQTPFDYTKFVKENLLIELETSQLWPVVSIKAITGDNYTKNNIPCMPLTWANIKDAEYMDGDKKIKIKINADRTKLEKVLLLHAALKQERNTTNHAADSYYRFPLTTMQEIILEYVRLCEDLRETRTE